MLISVFSFLNGDYLDFKELVLILCFLGLIKGEI